MQYFALNGVTAAIVPLPTMEANKDFELVFELARQMEHFKLNRLVAIWKKVALLEVDYPNTAVQVCMFSLSAEVECVPRV